MADGELVEIDLDVIKQFEKESWVKNLKMAVSKIHHFISTNEINLPNRVILFIYI